MKGFLILFSLYTLYSILYTTPVSAQTCGSSSTKLAEGLVTAPSLGGSTTFTTTGGCIVNPKAAFTPFSIPTYNDLESQYYTQSKLPICTGSNYPCKNNVSASTSLPGFSGSQVFSYSGNLTIDASSPSSGSGIQVIFVKGTLTFNSNYTYNPAQGGTVFIVKGNVNILSTVNIINAVIITEGILCTAFDGSSCPLNDVLTSQLIIYGGLISFNQTDTVPFKFKRSLIDNSQPAEKIIQQHKYLVLLKDLLSETTSKWSEITDDLSLLPTPPPCSNGYRDNDKDGKGAGVFACFPSSPTYNIVLNSTDCNDSSINVYENRSVARDKDHDGLTATTTTTANTCVGGTTTDQGRTYYRDTDGTYPFLLSATNPADCNDNIPGLCLPIVTTVTPYIGNTYATLNGTANPNGRATTGYFRYWISDPGSCNDINGTRAPASGGTALGSGSSAVAFSQPISGLTGGSTYYFCAIGNNSDGPAFGSKLSFTTVTCAYKWIGPTINTSSLICISTGPPTAPYAPTGLSAIAGNNQATLNWTQPSDNGSAIIRYKIYRSTTSGTETLLASPVGTGTSYTDSTAVNGILYYYQVSAVNSIGESAKSSEISVGIPITYTIATGFSATQGTNNWYYYYVPVAGGNPALMVNDANPIAQYIGSNWHPSGTAWGGMSVSYHAAGDASAYLLYWKAPKKGLAKITVTQNKSANCAGCYGDGYYFGLSYSAAGVSSWPKTNLVQQYVCGSCLGNQTISWAQPWTQQLNTNETIVYHVDPNTGGSAYDDGNYTISINFTPN